MEHNQPAPSKEEIAAQLRAALIDGKPFSMDLYVEVMAEHEPDLQASLDQDADDALLCVLADDGDVAMLVIDWEGRIFRNSDALQKLQSMWRHSFEANIHTLLPILSGHICQRNLGVAGIKWIPSPID